MDLVRIPAKMSRVIKRGDVIANINEEFWYYYLKEAGLNPLKTLRAKGTQLYYRNNFFVKYSKT
jgi:hypothetical protein